MKCQNQTRLGRHNTRSGEAKVLISLIINIYTYDIRPETCWTVSQKEGDTESDDAAPEPNT